MESEQKTDPGDGLDATDGGRPSSSPVAAIAGHSAGDKGDVSRTYALRRRKQRAPVRVITAQLGSTLGNLLNFCKKLKN